MDHLYFKNSNKALLILDLDETLIHACLTDRRGPPEINAFNFFIYKRPYLEEFLKDVFSLYNVAIWSTGSDDYVEVIAKAIQPEGETFEFVWGRSRCTARQVTLKHLSETYITGGGVEYIKPLKKLKKKGFSMDRILIVDDSPYKSVENYGNAIYIKPYTGDVDDEELYWLSIYLKEISGKSNFRSFEKRGWETSTRIIPLNK